MTIKIDAPLSNLEITDGLYGKDHKTRLVRDSDWRRIMAVVRAAEAWGMDDVGDAVNALRKHLGRK